MCGPITVSLTPILQFFRYTIAKLVNFQREDDEVQFVLDQHAQYDFYSASLLQQQSAARHCDTLS
jgi:hypothetical protein